MNNRERYLSAFCIFVTDVLLIIFSILFAFFARSYLGDVFKMLPLSHDIFEYLSRWWIPLTIILLLVYYGGYGIVVTVWDECIILVKGLFLSFLIVWGVLSLQKESESVSRFVVVLSFVILIFLLPIGRLAVKHVLYKTLGIVKKAYLYERRKDVRKHALRDLLNREWYPGFTIVDNIYKDDITDQVDTCFVPIEYADEETIRVLKPKTKNLIFFSVLSGLSFMNTDIKTFIGRDVALITTSNGLLSYKRVVMKRALDLFIAFLGLVVFSPFFLLIPLFIKADTPGPVYFRHARCGKKLNNFFMIKFRTMHVSGDRILNEYLKDHPEAIDELQETNKIKNDPRITRAGRLLRKTSLDELPQLINVIKGEMSIVGPRPDSKEAIQKYYEEYGEIYQLIKPGITGLWQVSGRSDVNYYERVKLDYLYMLNWSPWLDFVIIAKTFRTIFSGRGAY